MAGAAPLILPFALRVFGFSAMTLLVTLASRNGVLGQLERLDRLADETTGILRLTPMGQFGLFVRQLFGLESAPEAVDMSPAAVQELVAFAQSQLAILRASFGAPIPLPQFQDRNEAQAWFNLIVTGEDRGDISPTPEELDWARAHYRSELLRLSSLPLLEVSEATDIVQPVTVPLPRFSNREELQVWYAMQLRLFDSDRISEDEIGAVIAHYQGQLERLSTTIIIPQPDVLEGIEGRPIPAPTGQGLPGTGMEGAVAIPSPVAGQLGTPDISREIQSALGIGLFGLTAAGAMTWQNIGNAQHRGRLACSATSMSTMLAGVATAAAPLALSATLLGSQTGQRFIDATFGKFFDLIVDNDALAPIDNPADATQLAGRILAQKMALGASAHFMSVVVEMAAPLKPLGINQFAGMLADVAGFGRLASGTLGEVENAGITLWMRRFANAKYRSVLPMGPSLETAYAKKELAPGPIPPGFPPAAARTPVDESEPFANLYEVMSQQGMPDWWIRTASHHLFLDPRLFELVRIGTFFSPQISAATKEPPEFVVTWLDAREWLLPLIGVSREEFLGNWFFYFRASVAGYAYEDIRVIVETANRAVVRREQTLMLESITRLRRDGFLTEEAAFGLIEEAWGLRPGPSGEITFAGNPVLARVRATDMRTLTEVLVVRRNIITRAMRVGALTEEEARTRLAGLGMSPDRVDLEIVNTKLALLPGIRLEIDISGDDFLDALDEE